MSRLLVVSCAGDDRFSPVSMYLLKNYLSDVKEGVAEYAKDTYEEVIYLLPEGEEVSGLDAKVMHCKRSPVLTNPYAVAQVLVGNLPRPMIQDDFIAEYYDANQEKLHVNNVSEVFYWRHGDIEELDADDDASHYSNYKERSREKEDKNIDDW